MVQSAADALPLVRADTDALLDALLYAVPHDLRSPLLTLSLSAELLREVMSERVQAEPAGTGAVALDALKHGARELERMLQALASVSRARQRVLEPSHTPLRMLLGGHVVLSDEIDLARCLVTIDPLLVSELIDAICGEDPAPIEVTVTDHFAVLRLPHPAGIGDVRGAPLVALVESLQHHAGTPVEELAAGQVIVERLGGALDVDPSRVRVWLARANGGSPR